MTVDDLWFLADEARQRAEQAYHRLRSGHAEFIEPVHTRRVSRPRFRTLATRVKATGTPYGVHTVVRRRDDEILLVWHEGVDMWVLPGGGVDDGERFPEAARRELAEEAGITADYGGLAMATRVDIRCDGHQTWGVMPIYRARTETGVKLSVDDPDDEISEARWFHVDEIPADTRDRDDLLNWYGHVAGD
ncbi:NUDIX domain-containing protein [Haloferax mediterranei ATCC 33500]|uniref:Mut/nudix family protein / 7,8-dihydro-8-oxoguanine triphosphatase n=1 Tax=Haloferax mediterranei (strain ATCC 33500 / DSM 1411 / JCM 8866 / NBRC 14739 / NCIMB 2177 / R-4) TaxID=523841 RepID=I3R408_HALMT|nr:NUDIX domain-containing protein [Haloferax mediterranei]AFK18968.1 Mut/nudix family protein / 7,8-dihydro-8-oxoguanine triphosphatase [Haloferax mediterranei ATCC 33500]AHZ21671.1 NUDIX hydrolase [Haloferax mediterranei ATCC 33500]EMA03174.1 Mut/nudix family protein / 7,8-dihydro-8-oxoguanine triphosphatase [Haloferax mediterranei ATCC 33500]MDX5989059.1 NUDIX domain-containing protein [Haloferax mediterranei ATCC 33500]QCQ76629.1 NUDIX domain-containing protein [Haloferax mediterranei ATCC